MWSSASASVSCHLLPEPSGLHWLTCGQPGEQPSASPSLPQDPPDLPLHPPGLLQPPPAASQPVRNVYTFAFLVEMLNLAIVLFGSWAFGVNPRPRARTAFQTAQLSTWLSWELPPGLLGSWGCSVPPELEVGVAVSSLITRQTTGFLNSRGWSVSLPTPFLSLYLE